MKTAIIYYSKHHGNTKKLLDAIQKADQTVTLIDVTEVSDADLSGYDRIGLASGIYYNEFAKQVKAFAEAHLPENKENSPPAPSRSRGRRPRLLYKMKESLLRLHHTAEEDAPGCFTK